MSVFVCEPQSVSTSFTSCGPLRIRYIEYLYALELAWLCRVR